MLKRTIFLATCGALAACLILPLMAGDAQKISFQEQILPLIKGRCQSCHKGDAPPAGLNLMSDTGWKKGSANGNVVKAGDSKNSVLVHRIMGLDGKAQMPMNFAPLLPEEIQRIKDWIDQGATYDAPRKHWAYVVPKRPALPSVKLKGWALNPIDSFVLARMEKDGLRPSPEASKETLIRRVSLDLIGLPPTIEEITGFVNDKSPNAYEKVVDRLLASPHYGERQARPWLDLSRYADSNGYEKDNNRVAWPYRDWLINAFNKNLPFDQFTVQQLAGDLLPHPTLDQRVATGFHRNTMKNEEGGVDQDEAFYEVLNDRVATTATVWLGTTMGCAKCHNHKYDPFTQKDYYRLYAFYSNSNVKAEGPASIGEEKYYEPSIPVPTPEAAAKLATLRQEVEALGKQFDAAKPAAVAMLADWEKLAGTESNWRTLSASQATADSGASVEAQPDSSYRVTGKNPEKDSYTVNATIPSGGLAGIRLEALSDGALPNGGPGRADNGNFVLTYISATLDGKAVPLMLASQDLFQDQWPASGALTQDINSGWAMLPGLGKNHQAVFQPLQPMQGSKLSVRLEFQSIYPRHTIGHFRLSVTEDADPALRMVPERIKTLLNKQRTEKESQELQAYYLSVAPALVDLNAKKMAAQKQLDDLTAQQPVALVMQEKPVPYPLAAWVHKRGEFLTKTELVYASTPASLPPMPKDLPRNRLGLAEWLVSPENPLTARVEVNRIWEQYFGRGIVETCEDFGTQGARPTHPELLDWLATEFTRTGWDMKKMNRLIVTSATYRQSSAATPELIEKDPQNLLLARGPRFRMEAEMIRDNALAVAGLLSPKIGGPSVYPDQPELVWNTPYNGQDWMPSKGEDRFRRGIYTFWKRSAPYPVFLVFDATSREYCTVRRIRTNTPLQALNLMNDTTYIEAAKGLAKQMIEHGLSYGFQLCTARQPSAQESERLQRLFEKTVQHYEAQPEEAKKLAGDATTSAWTVVANVLLNLDETLTKG